MKKKKYWKKKNHLKMNQLTILKDFMYFVYSSLLLREKNQRKK